MHSASHIWLGGESDVRVHNFMLSTSFGFITPRERKSRESRPLMSALTPCLWRAECGCAAAALQAMQVITR